MREFQDIGLALKKDARTDCDEPVDTVSVEILKLCKRVEHLSTPHGVPDHSNLGFPCSFKYFGYHCWDVFDGHIGPIEIPTLFQAPLVVFFVVITVLDASCVAKPYVVAAVD